MQDGKIWSRLKEALGILGRGALLKCSAVTYICEQEGKEGDKIKRANERNRLIEMCGYEQGADGRGWVLTW